MKEDLFYDNELDASFLVFVGIMFHFSKQRYYFKHIFINFVKSNAALCAPSVVIRSQMIISQ